MTTQSTPELSSPLKNLRKMVGLAVGNSMPSAVQRNSFIVNEVPDEFHIATDEIALSNVLDRLLHTIVNSSKHSCIRVKAKEYDDIIFLCVKDNSSFSDYHANDHMDEVKQLARKMNGSVTIENTENNSTKILLTFPNFPKAA
ncbi:MAG: hypothetical protein JWP81_3957 [Ferruginibacter sp.]|nr:hypothetical protein [Ferruginibacter sp.]